MCFDSDSTGGTARHGMHAAVVPLHYLVLKGGADGMAGTVLIEFDISKREDVLSAISIILLINFLGPN